MAPGLSNSRLFRPWDSSGEDSSSDLLCGVKHDSTGSQSPLHSNTVFDEVPECAYVPDPIGINEIDHYSSRIPTLAECYQYPNGLRVPPPTHALSHLSVALMEQEYARVLAEEALQKNLNSRKNRPKKFKCPHCDVAFSNNGQLKGHIRIHTGERPFKCDVETCGKTFTRNEELTRHKRIHTGLRPYACQSCGKRFGRRDHLKKHMKTHMPQDRHLSPALLVTYPLYHPYVYGY